MTSSGVRPSSSGRRQAQQLRGNMRQVLLVAALLVAASIASYKLGSHRQLRLSIRQAAAAAPPPPRCAEQLVNATAAMAPGRPQKPEQVA